ncbi:AcrR family transcriptional regulator [Microlunatus parietis]|uniref:AcrR family transcriptional regulator n=1 Tax=Microlunatus parietis TaxID=682979 RepID=A0A7Y9I3S2_9ACTN|nr:AcrR family transcriptional regulator [Microlunatus parietis]
MARIRDDEAFRRKRDAILDVADRLMIIKGYESLAITDLMTEAGISKGALYHYFTSKRAVLAALLDRRLDRWEAALAPLANGAEPAAERLRTVLRALAMIKAEDRSFLISVLRGLYREDNAIVQTTARAGMADRLLPLLSMIINDGRADGSFAVTAPEPTARVVISLLQECSDRIARLLIDIADGRGSARAIEAQAAAYVEALHRILGAPPGTLDFVEPADLRRWIRAARTARSAAADTSPEAVEGQATIGLGTSTGSVRVRHQPASDPNRPAPSPEPARATRPAARRPAGSGRSSGSGTPARRTASRPQSAGSGRGTSRS